MELTGNVSGLINLGGGGGSTVEVTPILTSGEHIADIEVDGVTSELYAPEPTEPTEVEVTQVISSGIKIATIAVDGEETDIFSPDSGGGFCNFSLIEQDTGIKWLNGESVFQKSYNITGVGVIASSGKSITNYIDNRSDMKHIINSTLHKVTSAGTQSASPAMVDIDTSSNVTVYSIGSLQGAYITIQYLKV